jgi:hypothetical protein
MIMLKQRKLAVAVATLVGASAASIGTTQADVVFFPFLVNGPTITSIVSTMNSGEAPAAGAYEEALHYRLYYKPVTAGHLDACNLLSVRRPTSKYDINTVDLSGKFGQGTLGVLFNDPSVINYPATTPSFSFAQPLPPHRGYLLVDNETSGGMAGEMFILELTTGAAWGYQGIQSAEGATAADADFTAEVSASPSQVALMPLLNPSDVVTKFTVTPIGPTMLPGLVNKYASTVLLDISDDSTAPTLDAAYDRDELPVDGGVPKTVVCVGVVEASTLVASAGNELPDGGWSNLHIVAPSIPDPESKYTPVDGAISFKVEYGEDTFDGEPLQGMGIYNNGFRLEPEVDGG